MLSSATAPSRYQRGSEAEVAAPIRSRPCLFVVTSAACAAFAQEKTMPKREEARPKTVKIDVEKK